ncbi:MAG: hypothetical protein R3D29_00180 [Nitratireductor sp.]
MADIIRLEEHRHFQRVHSDRLEKSGARTGDQNIVLFNGVRYCREGDAKMSGVRENDASDRKSS